MSNGIDAAIYWPPNEKAYFFKGTEYVRYTPGEGVDEGYPKSIRSNWKRWPLSFAEIDAAVYWPQKEKGYFFNGSEYIRYTPGKGVDDGYPKAIRSNWKRWPDNFSEIDVAIYWPPNGKAYFFKGTEYLRYTPGEGVDEGYPRSIHSNWTRWPDSFSGVDAAVYWPPNEKAYFFSGSEYVRYTPGEGVDEGYPKSIHAAWTKWPAVWTPGTRHLEPPTRVALKAINGLFVSTEESGAATLRANQGTLGERETFEMHDLGHQGVSFKAANGQYVGHEEDGTRHLLARSASIGEREIFQLLPLDESRVTILASNGFYVGSEEGGAAPLRANRDQAADWETFEVVLADGEHESASEEGNPEHTPNPQNHQTSSGPSSEVFTVCFAGTGCTRDEGEASRPESDREIYCSETGYIPVRIHKEISGDLRETWPSVTVRGVGENDWATPRKESEPLYFGGPLEPHHSLLRYVKSYSGGNQYSTITQLNGWSAPALALHGANIAAASGARQLNFIGHSRGAVEAIMAAWFLYAYGADEISRIPINIFAIDPVPGTGEWYSILTQLPPNVANYVGVYAWDHGIQPCDNPFMALVPRPNGSMMGQDNGIDLPTPGIWQFNPWQSLADNSQKQDPLEPAGDRQPTGYELFACRGRHSTVAGNSTSNAQYDPEDSSPEVEPVPKLVYRMARAYLTQWGVDFTMPSAVAESAMTLREDIHLDHRLFDTMGGGATRNSVFPERPYVRRISSIYGINPFNSYFMDNAVGDPPYTMAYPVTKDRENAGWVHWKFL